MIKDYTTGLQHIGIPTNSMDKTIEFYKSLGFEIICSTVIEEGTVKAAFLKLNNIIIEAYENKNARMVAGAIDHIAINVVDINTVFKYMKNQNYELLDDEIQELPFFDNGVLFFTIVGPNAEKIEFNQIL
jgi:catechol 2,3-dioxygenase-like lactoylglutathione lyase family enzyme